jgi:hypothetical protein
MSRRRYKCGQFPEYDREFDKQKGRSGYLNPQWGHLDFDFTWFGLDSIRNLKAEIGYFEQPEGRIEKAQAALAAVGKGWEDTFRRQGQPVPASPPDSIIRQQHESEARLDILMEECDLLKKRLAKMEAAAQTQDDSAVLRYGPAGQGQGDPLRILDGQRISEKQGELFIDDPRSPYNGMKTSDYFAHVVKPFKQQYLDLSREWEIMTKDERRQFIKDGGTPPQMFSGRTYSRAELPARPEGF